MTSITLIGSEKQVAWATKIRENIESRLERLLELFDMRVKCGIETMDAASAKIVRDRIVEMTAIIMAHDAAEYWIKNRESDPITMMRNIWFEKTGTRDYKII